MENLISNYLYSLRSILENIDTASINSLATRIRDAIKNGENVFIAGNGGSASTASHFATDLGVGTSRLTKPVKAISLCENTSVLTAISNDLDFKLVFAQQLKTLGNSGDLLILISASGNSENLIESISTAKSIGIEIYSLTGFDGGKIKELTAGNNIHVQTNYGEYGPVEDAHLAICHIITECIRG